MMIGQIDNSRHGASSVSPQAEEVPGSLPRRSPPQATEENIELNEKPLKILQWNAEGVNRKKACPREQTEERRCRCGLHSRISPPTTP